MLTSRVFIAVSLILLLCGVPSQARLSETFEAPIEKQHWHEIVLLYEKLSEEEKCEPENLYLAGYAHMRLNEYDDAVSFFDDCENVGFTGFDGWLPIDTFQNRLSTLHDLCPPKFKDFSNGKVSLTVYGRENEWTSTVFGLFPGFLARAREVFGDDAPPIDFYFFDKLADYNRSFEAMFWGHVPTHRQAGTGETHLVAFSEFAPDGSVQGKGDIQYRQGCVIHEYGHALCNTVYGESFLGDCPRWLNEGMADCFAKPYFHEHFKQAVGTLKWNSTRQKPPSYDQLVHHLYEGNEYVNYALGLLMTERILKDKPASAIKLLLDSAKAHDGDFELAIREVCGRSGKSVYDEILKDYWRP